MEYTITQVKKDLNAIVSSRQTTIILKNGKPESVLMPFEQYRNMSREIIRLHEEAAVEISKKIAKGEMEDMLQDGYEDGVY